MPRSKKSPPSWVPKLVLLFLFAIGCLLYANLGRDPLFDWDEGIYGQLGAELLESGQLFISSWNYSPWFEKPPGIAWLSALGQLVGGHTPYGARLFMPFLSTLTLYLLYLLGTKLKNWRVGLMAVGFLSCFNLFLGRTRALNTDLPLLLGIITTPYFVITNKKPVAVALVVALSVWFKGLAGLLPVLISLPLILTQSKKYSLLFTLYSLLYILPWHLYSYLRFGQEFVTPYFLEQVVRRATIPIEFHLESRWFYFQYLYDNLGLGMLVGLGLGVILLCYRFYKTRELMTLTLLWWLLFPLALFTLVKTRLFWYILPIYPAIALILAYLLDSFAKSKQSRLVLTILTLGILAQGVLSVSRSVELTRATAPLSDRLTVASALSRSQAPLAVLVPPTERVAEAVLPLSQRLSSSFRYGGMPSVVFYYQGPVRFFYNVDEFNTYWVQEGKLAMIHIDDQALVADAPITVTTPTYLGMQKEDIDAVR